MNPILNRSVENLFLVGGTVDADLNEENKIVGLNLAYASDVANDAGFTLMRVPGKLRLVDLIGQINDEGLEVDMSLPHSQEVLHAADSGPERNYSLVLVSNDEVTSRAPAFEPIPIVIAVQMLAARILAKEDTVYMRGTYCLESIGDGSLRAVVGGHGDKIVLTAGLETSDSQVSMGKMIRIS